MSGIKISGLSGEANSTDDSVLMMSYTTDGGATYQSRKIRTIDLIDDFSVGDLADVDTSTTPPTNGQALVWVDANNRWEPVTILQGSDSIIDGGNFS